VLGTKKGKLMKKLMKMDGASMKEGDGWDGADRVEGRIIMNGKNGVLGVISSRFLSCGFDLVLQPVGWDEQRRK